MSDFTEANRKAFDDLASTYNSKPWQVRISQQVTDALRQRKDWLGVQWTTTPSSPNNNVTAPTENDNHRARLLDYACGTGSVTSALAPSVTTIRAIDLSPNMVERYNAAARAAGLDDAHAVVGDLLAASGPSEAFSGRGWFDFDVAVVGLGFHHFEDAGLAARRLAERVRAGTGVVVVVDFLPFEGRAGHVHGHGHGHGGAAGSSHDGHGHKGEEGGDADGPFPQKMQQTIKHHGFTAEGLRELFEAAGLEDFGFDVLPEPAVFEFEEGRRERKVFVAKGRKKSDGS